MVETKGRARGGGRKRRGLSRCRPKRGLVRDAQGRHRMAGTSVRDSRPTSPDRLSSGCSAADVAHTVGHSEQATVRASSGAGMTGSH